MYTSKMIPYQISPMVLPITDFIYKRLNFLWINHLTFRRAMFYLQAPKNKIQVKQKSDIFYIKNL